MNPTLRLMCVFAHPDDESMGTGSTIAKYTSEGIETYLVAATRGERGWGGSENDYPGQIPFGKLRQAELIAASQVLGIRQVYFLDYIDGELDQVNPNQAIHKICNLLRLVRPQVVVTFGPDGAYGHPDHIAISQFTTAALVCAADPDCNPNHLPPHRVSKLYFMTDTRQMWADIEAMIGEIHMLVDGTLRKPVLWEDWAITTRIHGGEHWRTALKAVCCHQSQIADFHLDQLTDDQQRLLWGDRTYYRAMSLVNGGRGLETDLFSGLR
jgi:LmbE family N-acetylglucosaminyl deacetylase